MEFKSKNLLDIPFRKLYIKYMNGLYKKLGIWRMDWNWIKEHSRGFKKYSKRVVRRHSKQEIKKMT